MSTAPPPLPRLPSMVATAWALATSAVEAVVTLVQGAAFWASIPLPLVITGALLTDVVASAPQLVGGLVLLNVVCAVFGQNYSPRT